MRKTSVFQRRDTIGNGWIQANGGPPEHGCAHALGPFGDDDAIAGDEDRQGGARSNDAVSGPAGQPGALFGREHARQPTLGLGEVFDWYEHGRVHKCIGYVAARTLHPMARQSHDEARYGTEVREAWAELGDRRAITGIVEVSALVSTNHVYRLLLSDGASVIAKVSSYGSYFLFREDHDRIYRARRLLQDTRWARLLADVIVDRDGRVFTHYNGEMWTAFYEDVPQGSALPRVLSEQQSRELAEEMALLHRDCADVARKIPLSSKSIKSDAIHLLDLLSDPHSAKKFPYGHAENQYLRRQCHEFLEQLDRFGYDDWAKIPVLIDWNLGNFSVSVASSDSAAPNDDQIRLFSRWDYDWFRIEPRLMDFYFLSRVASATGDRTVFSYSPHTLLEPRFIQFLRAYHRIFPLRENEILFLREVYRFFILNYVVREGDNFFLPEYWRRLQHEAVSLCLPAAENLDLTPLLAILS